MKIKLTRPLRGDEGTRPTGAIVERADAVAESLIRRGLATAVNEDEQGTAETTPPPAPKPKRKPKAKTSVPKPPASKAKRKSTPKSATAPKGD